MTGCLAADELPRSPPFPGTGDPAPEPGHKQAAEGGSKGHGAVKGFKIPSFSLKMPAIKRNTTLTILSVGNKLLLQCQMFPSLVNVYLNDHFLLADKKLNCFVAIVVF